MPHLLPLSNKLERGVFYISGNKIFIYKIILIKKVGRLLTMQPVAPIILFNNSFQ